MSRTFTSTSRCSSRYLGREEVRAWIRAGDGGEWGRTVWGWTQELDTRLW